MNFIIAFTFFTINVWNARTGTYSFHWIDPPHIWPTQRLLLVTALHCWAAAPAGRDPVDTANSELARTIGNSCSAHSSCNVGGNFLHGGSANTKLDESPLSYKGNYCVDCSKCFCSIWGRQSPTGLCWRLILILIKCVVCFFFFVVCF